MSDYIKREDALKAIEVCVNESVMPEEWRSGMLDAYDEVKSYVPSADVVKVVRCKECIHRPIVIDPDKPDCGFNLRPPQNDEGYEDWSCHFLCDDGYYSRMPSDDDFCSRGERKERDDE